MTSGTSAVDGQAATARGRRDLVASRVAAARARRAAPREGTAGPASAPGPEPAPPEREGPDPLSSAQRRLWFLQQLEPGSAAYNIPVVWDVEGELDADRLRAAWEQVVRRHHVLRTRITTVEDEPRPVLDEEPADHWWTGETQDVEADTRALVATPFDLASTQPWRVRLLRTGPSAWRLAAVVHHVAADGWSVRVLMDDLAACYAGTELAPLSWQYADVARHRALSAAEDRTGLGHWTRHLDGAPPVLALPTDRLRPATASPDGATTTLHLPPGSVEGLRAVCAATGVTPFVAVLGAVRTVLARWSGSEDLVVGTPVAGRGVPAWERLVGCFVNTVALRTTSDPQTSVRDLVWHVQDVTLHGLEHQDVPFEEVVDAVSPVRDVSTTPIYQVLLTVHTEPEPRLELGSAACTWVDVAVPVAKNDLSLHVVGGALDLAGGDDDLVVQATYRTALFDGATVRRLLGHVGAVLARMPRALDTPVAALPLTTAEEEARLPSEVGADVAPATPRADCVPGAVRAVAREHPDRPAVRSRDEQLTYGELVAAGDRLAARLRAQGVGRGDRVGLLLERSCDVVVGMLAAMSAGAAYVPLEPAYPDERLRALVSGADLRVVVSQRHLAGRAGEGVRVLLVEDAPDTGTPAPPSADVGAVRPDDVAYVLFTSGTTGRPKGVEVEHRHLLAYLDGLRWVTGLEDGWSWAMVTTPSSDLGLTNLFGALTSGGLVHLLTYEQVTDPDAVAAYLAEHPVDAMKLVPGQLASWLGARAAAEVLPRRLLVLAGEACPWELVEEVHRAAPGLLVHNHYGPTETTVSTMAHPVPRGRRTSTGPVVPLGRPFPGTRAHVVDADLRPVPTGVPGELVLAGPTVARGYLGRPDLTAERWVPEPVGGTGGRAYRSGDLVRRLPSGDVEFLGRVDDQVKIRGYRVEPGEVAAVAKEVAGVTDCVVVPREDRPGARTLAAYVTGQAGAGSVDVEALRAHLRANLPDHMVPADVVPLDAVPLTRNGKVDRDALPVPDPAARSAGRTQEPLRTPAEHDVARAWSEVLGMEVVSVTDNFFDLGGDSFSAVRAVRALDRGLSVVDLFTRPTVRELAALCEGGTPDEGGPHSGPRMLRRLDRGRAATATHLVCVPYGGGSAVTFMPLAEQVGPGVAVHGVDLPGHDPGRRDEQTRSLEEVAEELAEEVAALEGDVVIYGHCLGGALAVRTALAVEARGRPVLGVVAAGTFPAARLPGPVARLLDRVIPSDRWLSDRAYHDMLRSLGGFTDVVDPEDRAFLVRALRHDSREAEGYYTRRFAGEEAGSGADRLSAPMLCVVGERDRATELYEERFAEWEEFADDVELAVVPAAGHYFLKHQAEELAELLQDRVRAWRAGARPRSRSAVAAGETARTSTFLWVALTQLMSMLGTGLTSFALGIWVLQETGSVTRFALISVMAVTPAILLSPVAGAVADRHDRRRVMLLADGTAGLVTGGLVLLVATGSLDLWYIYVYAAVGSAANAFQRPAYLAAVTQLVPKQYLGQANGLVTLGTSAADLLAALVGGILIGLLGLGWVIAVDVVTFLSAMAVLVLVRFPDRLWLRREETFWTEVRGGFRYIVRRRPLVVMVVFFVVFNLLFALPLVLVPSFVLATSTPQVVGAVLAAGGVGALAGAVTMGLWGGTRRRALGMVGGTAVLGVGVLVTGLTNAPWVQALGMFVVYASLVVLNAHWLSLIQTKVGIELQGRVLGVNQMLAMSTMPVGFLTVGPLTERLRSALDAGALPDLPAALGLDAAGGHLGLALVVTGAVLLVWGVGGLLTPSLRLMEDALPDTVPDAVQTWDRDELQQRADAQLEAFLRANADDQAPAGSRT